MSEGNGLDLNILFNHDRDIMASIIVGLWTNWSTANNKAQTMWDEVRRYIFATSTKDTANDGAAPWSNTTHRPKIANIYDTLTINYEAGQFPNDDHLVWEGSDKESATKDKAQVVTSYMRTKHKLKGSNFRKAHRECQANWTWTGNAFAQIDYVQESSVDPETGAINVGYVGPRTTAIDPRKIVFNPLASSFEESPKIIRSLYTMAEISRIIEERPDMQYFREIKEQVVATRKRFRQFDQGDLLIDSSLQFDGFGTAGEYFNSGLVEVLDFYGDIYEESTETFRKNHVITVVDRFSIVRDEPLNTWSGRPLIFHVAWRSRIDNLWGQGPLENLVGLQYRIDHLENARADAFDQMIDPDIVFAGDIEEVMQVGGAKHYYIAENGTVAHLRPDTTVLNADLQIAELTNAMEQFALAPREALGIRSPGEKTAFEVAELATASGRAFENKNMLYSEFMESCVNAELEVSVRNLDTADVITVVDDETGSLSFRTITKADITANGKLVPVGARHFARNGQLIQNLTQMQLGPLSDPEVAQHFSSLGLAELFQELLDLQGSKKTLVSPYIRVSERLEAQRRTNAAADIADEEALTSTTGEPPVTQEIQGDLSGGRGTEQNFGGFGTQ